MEIEFTIGGLSQALASKELSSVELTQMALSRLRDRGAKHRVARELTEARALAEAKESDERRAKGKTLGPLDGIPYGVKDLLATKGIPTRWGSVGHSDQVFDYDATVVKRLSEAGAVLVAKLSMIELAGGGGYDVPWATDMGGAVLSSASPALWAGGSSSGSGAAVGLGCLPFAIGSETSGSILCPCAFNGISGIRPTYGRVSRHGAMALSWTLDKVGVLSRMAEDSATVLSVIAGRDPADKSTTFRPFAMESGSRKPVVGVVKEAFAANRATACEEGYNRVIENLRRQGYEVVPVTIPPVPSAGLAVSILVDGDGASAHENFIRSENIELMPDKQQLAGLKASLEQPTVDYLWAMRVRTEMEASNAVWRDCDVLFRPIFYQGAVAADKPLSQTWVRMGNTDIPLANLLGWPAAAIPMAVDPATQGPIGGQFIGPAFADADCLRVAKDATRRLD